MFSISQNHVSPQFLIVKSHLGPSSIILAISREITQKFAKFSLKITKSRENCLSRISWFWQIVKHEIMFTFNSRKFGSQSITSTVVAKKRKTTLLVKLLKHTICIFLFLDVQQKIVECSDLPGTEK